MAECVTKLRTCVGVLSNLDGLPSDTVSACKLVAHLASHGISCCSERNAQSVVSPPGTVPSTQVLRVGCLNPHRNGLANVQGTAVVWKRLTDESNGLFRVLSDFSFSLLGLPACRVFADFSLPAFFGADIASVGGVSYGSVGVLRPLEMCCSSEVVWEESTKSSMIVKLEGAIVVIFALPTPSGPDSDERWVAEFTLGAEAGQRVLRASGCDCVIWMGDFNFEPEEVSGKPDPRATCRKVWDNNLKSYEMSLLNPRGHVEGVQETLQKISLPLQGKVVDLRSSSTFMYGGRAIDLVCVSARFKGRSKLLVHNGIHCTSNGCSRGWCKEAACSDHFLVELTVHLQDEQGVAQSSLTSRPRLA